MQRNTFFALLFLALGLGAYVYFYEIEGEEGRQLAEDATKQLFTVKNEQVQSLIVENTHGRFEFTRVDPTKPDSGWKLAPPQGSSPTELVADSRAVEDALFALNAMRYTKVLEEKTTDLSPFGLATPSLKVTYKSPEGEQTLLAGDEAPFGAGRYIMRNTDPRLYLTTYPLQDRLNKDLLGWRDRKLLNFTLTDVKRIQISSLPAGGSAPVTPETAPVAGTPATTGTAGEAPATAPQTAGPAAAPAVTLDLTREGESWKSASNPDLLLDTASVDALLYDLQGLQAQTFTGQTDPALFGLAPAQLTVTLELGDARTKQTLFLGAEFGDEKQVPAITEAGQEIKLLDAGVFAKLRKTPTDFRDSRVVNVKRFSLEKLTVKAKDQTLEATKDGDGWKLDGTLKDTAKTSDVDAVLDDLVALRGEEFLDNVAPADLALYGLDAAPFTLTLTEKDNQTPVSLEVASTGEGEARKVYVRLNQGSSVVRVNKYLLQDLEDVLLKSSKKAE